MSSNIIYKTINNLRHPLNGKRRILFTGRATQFLGVFFRKYYYGNMPDCVFIHYHLLKLAENVGKFGVYGADDPKEYITLSEAIDYIRINFPDMETEILMSIAPFRRDMDNEYEEVKRAKEYLGVDDVPDPSTFWRGN